jgi:hypothetical protein
MMGATVYYCMHKLEFSPHQLLTTVYCTVPSNLTWLKGCRLVCYHENARCMCKIGVPGMTLDAPGHTCTSPTVQTSPSDASACMHGTPHCKSQPTT